MKHPEFLLVPLLMVSDYLLTIAGSRLRKSGYSDHFRVQHYELNPLWQRAVQRGRWLNPRHLALVLLVTLLFFAIANLSATDDDPLTSFILGFAIGLQGMINGRHLGNLAIFAQIKRHPEQIDGFVAINHELTLRLSMYQTSAVLLPLALLAAYVPHPAVRGAGAGVAAMMLVHLIWIARYRRQRRNRSALRDQAGTEESARSLPPSTASGTNLP